MRKDKISDFNRRIAQSNSTGIIAVLFDMIQEDFTEAEDAYRLGDLATAMTSLNHATRVLEHLQNALDFKYEISGQLYSLYDFAKRQLAKSVYQGNDSGMQEAQKILNPLQKAFEKIAAEDNSAPIMKNTQQIYAGMTYGRDDISVTTREGNLRGLYA